MDDDYDAPKRRARGHKGLNEGAGANSDGARLQPYIDRIIVLEQQKRDVMSDIKALYGEVESASFMPAAVRHLVKTAMQDDVQRSARLALEHEIDRLSAALGEFKNTPLGGYAFDQVRPQ